MILEKKKTKVVSCLLASRVQNHVEGFLKKKLDTTNTYLTRVYVVSVSKTGTPLFGAVPVLHT